MFKHLRWLLPLLVVMAVAGIVHATATPVQQGGVCVNCYTSGGGVPEAVTTSAVVSSLVSANKSRTSVTLYCTTAMNIEPGDTAGTAPTILPTTGAAGSGIGFLIPATTMVTISGNNLPMNGNGGVVLNLPPGDRIDAIAATANGYCYTWEQF